MVRGHSEEGSRLATMVVVVGTVADLITIQKEPQCKTEADFNYLVD